MRSPKRRIEMANSIRLHGLITRLGLCLITFLTTLGFVQLHAGLATAQGIQDRDGDTIYDIFDNCVDVPNGPSQPPSQLDTDGDGIGNACDADFDQDGSVSTNDFASFLADFGGPGGATDADGDGVVTASDFALLLSQLGQGPGESGLSCASAGRNIALGDRPCRVSQEDYVVPGQYIVVLANPDEEQDEAVDLPDLGSVVGAMLQPFGAQPNHLYDTVLRGFAVSLDPGQAEQLLGHSDVEYIDPVMVVRHTGTQSPVSWSLDRIDDRDPVYDDTFEYQGTGRGVHAYVLDSGIRTTHSEFEGRAFNSVDFVGDGSWHCHAHGTNVASIIGGVTYGVAKKVKLHNVRVLDCAGSGTTDRLISGLEWVAENHVAPAVANVSIGWSDPVVIHSVTDAVKELVDTGVTTVVSAGNERDDACGYPMAKVDRVLTVGGVDVSDTRSTWTVTTTLPDGTTSTVTKQSNWGACVDLFAPGLSVLGAVNSSDTATGTWWGTSQAAPHVAGAAALYLSRHPHAHPTEVASQIVGHASGGDLFNIGTGSPDLMLFTKGGEHIGDSVASGDIDGDGVDEVVVGSPGADDGGAIDSGQISIVQAGGSGPFALGISVIGQDSSGVWGSSEDGDAFGGAIAIDDFDGDGYDDVAVSMMGDSINGADSAGAVNVFYGSASGVSVVGEDRLHQDHDWMLDSANNADWFGAALAAGDFDGDGFADLAIGVPGEDDGGVDHSGAVSIVYGSSGGMSELDQLFGQSGSSISGNPEAGDLFGAALAVGDFDCDQRDDLAIGSPGESIGSDENAGRVVVLYGTSTGLNASDAQSWHQDSAGVSGGAEHGDLFGAALAAGDFDGDGCDDLAIGDPGEDFDSDEFDAGMVNILYGRSSGLSSSGEEVFRQGPTIAGRAEDRDLFGVALATGDFDGNGRKDLAVGVSGEVVNGVKHAGMVNMIYGASSGLTTSGNHVVHEDTSGVSDDSEIRDRFGDALAAGDLDGDGYDELIVGVPGEDDGSNRNDEGGIHTFYGSSSDLSTVDWTY
jgi:subtilisin family serine protease